MSEQENIRNQNLLLLRAWVCSICATIYRFARVSGGQAEWLLDLAKIREQKTVNVENVEQIEFGLRLAMIGILCVSLVLQILFVKYPKVARAFYHLELLWMFGTTMAASDRGYHPIFNIIAI